MISAATIAELNQLLAGTSIATLTLSTPSETITLHRAPDPSLPGLTRQPRPSSTAPSVTGEGRPVTAPCSGVFLHRHLLRETPLVQVGQGVQAGAVLGLLQAGPLLLHITAPHAGIVTAVATEATVAGYGTALVHLATAEEE